MADSAVAVVDSSNNNLQSSLITMQSSSSSSSTVHQQQQQQSSSSTGNSGLITLPPSVSISADIQVENLSINKNENDKLNRPGLAVATDDDDDGAEPDLKRRRLDSKRNKRSSEIFDKLESRLGGILSCAVCLDLPKTSVFQCQMGHLMCAACFTHLLADGRLRDQVATCPNCRVEISKTSATRNLAVEKAVSELPSECQFCNEEFPNRTLMYHQELYCEERPTNCQYSRIGCQWRGPVHETTNHEQNCAHPRKTGAEVMLALEAKDKELIEEKKLFSIMVDLLSYEKIIFNDLQLKPYRTDEYVHKLYYETTKFSAFNHQWVVKATINNNQRDPHRSTERHINYQLLLKTKTSCPLYIHYVAVKGPFSDIKINTQIYNKCFTDDENESDYNLLPLPDSSECNRLLAAKTINFRLIMFLLSK